MSVIDDFGDLEVLEVGRGTPSRRAAPKPPGLMKGDSSWGPDESLDNLSQKSQQRRVALKIKGVCKGARVSASLEETGIVWVQDRKPLLSKTDSGRGRRTATAQKRRKVRRFPYADLISVGVAADEAADAAVRVSISARRACDGGGGGQWRLVEREIRLTSTTQRRDAERWVDRVERALDGTPTLPRRRVRSVGLFVNAGASGASTARDRVVLPMLAKFGVRVVARADALDADRLAEAVAAPVAAADAADAAVIVGGDGTVQRVSAALLRGAGRGAGRTFPLCLVPAGRQSDVARSLLGGAAADPVSAMLHLLAGHTNLVNCSRVSTRKAGATDADSKALTWCFNASYGLPTDCLKYLDKYRLFPDSRYERALNFTIDRRTSNGYACDLQLLLPASGADEHGHPTEDSRCQEDCSVCQSAELAGRRQLNGDDDTDSVQEFDPLDSSNSSSGMSDLAALHRHHSTGRASSRWISVKGNYSWVGVYALSGLSDQYPRGLAPSGHRNDGCLDVVLLAESNRKEAAKFVRALASGSHLSMALVSSYRCTALRFQPRANNSWNMPDRRDEIDIDVEAGVAPHQSRQPHQLVLDSGADVARSESDCDNDGATSEPQPPPQCSGAALADLLCDSSGSEDGGGAGDNKATATTAAPEDRADSTSTDSASPAKAKSRRPSITSRLARLVRTTPGVANARTSGDGDSASPSPPVRTLAEIGRERRRLWLQEKTLARAAADEARLRSRWNLDHSEIDDLEVEFCCQPNVLEIFCPGATRES